MQTTFSDAIAHLMDYLGSSSGAEHLRDAKRAVLEAYRDLANAHRWSYLYAHGRVILSAPFSDGTVAYDNTGGTAERQLTISGATWPTWAGGGYVRINDVTSKVVDRISATVLQLDEQVNPGADIASGATFTLYRDGYLLPVDYVGGDQALYEQAFVGMQYVHPREWLYSQRFVLDQGQPWEYTVMGDPLYPGRLLLKIAPTPVESKTLDFLYHRRPRALTIADERRGTVSITSGSGVVTGVGTVFTPGMVGSVFRVSGTAQPPTSLIGDNPAAFESRVHQFVSATQIVLEDDAASAFSGAKFIVSDPVDIEEGAMLNAFLRRCEACICQNRTLKDKPSAQKLYLSALGEAKAADSRSFAGRSAGSRLSYRPRLRDLPGQPDPSFS